MKMFTIIRRWLERIKLFKIGRLFYWLRAHTYNKYHIVNLSGVDGYNWGWIDTDYKMFLAIFKLFEDFMEGEYLNGFVDWDYETATEDVPQKVIDGYKKRHNEMKEIYNWWKTGRLEENKAKDDLLELYDDKYVTFEPSEVGYRMNFHEDNEELKLARELARIYSDFLEEKETLMLHRLIDIRRGLWT